MVLLKIAGRQLLQVYFYEVVFELEIKSGNDFSGSRSRFILSGKAIGRLSHAGFAQISLMRFLPRSKRRSSRGGSTLAEFAPALIILLIFIFFPVLDLLSLCFDYGLVAVLNYNRAHRGSLIPSDQANDPDGTVKRALVDQWQNGFGHFAKLSDPPQTTLSYRNGQQTTTIPSTKS